ncbi:APC family permease [Acidocella aromatica]|uniref:Amino acid transporter n=1 Tax=Acidocella aromatica TaxID=1303579 RepID=A0A840VR28_9PROT|nr:APC family permease [Acidocella aromatica]MBB5372742.1 amino acid transporter [Acidocella aromatica]
MNQSLGSVVSSKLKRDVHLSGLLFASTTSIVGSGWLFGAYHAARIAGPLSIWSWVVGAVIIMLIALCFAELAALFPRSGALVHMSHASHGEGLGRIWGWMLFLAYVPVPAVEGEAVVTYANNYVPYFIQPGSNGLLTVAGFIVCALLLGLFAALNLLAVRLLLRVNSAVTLWKIAVPLLTVIVLIAASSRWNVAAAAPGSYNFDGIFTALPTAGVIFSFLGFRTAIDLGGESSNPGRNIPLAVIGSVLLAGILYALLQVAFLAALSPGDLANGWDHLSFSGQAGPFAGLAATLGIGWMATLLYIDAYISPGGTGLMYLTAGSRILFAMGETNAGPRWLMALNKVQAPWLSVLVMWAVGVLFLLPFPAWQLMVGYITSVNVLTYGLGPVVLLVLRRSQPGLARPFRLKAAGLLAPLAFVCSNWIIYWTGFRTDTVLFLVIGIGFALYAVQHHVVAKKPAADFGWRYIAWLLPWFGGDWVISALSTVGGGYGLIGFWTGVALTAVWSLIVISLALRAALPAEETAEMMIRMESTI